MATAHVGHDCQVGDDVTIANAVLLAGHVHVGEGAFLGGASAAHQFCRIGRLAIIGGFEVIRKDVPPFGAVVHGGLKAYNAIGCRRAGFCPETTRAIRAAYRQIHAHRSPRKAADVIESNGSVTTPEVREIVEFLRAGKRGITASYRFARDSAASNAADATD
jgi:UDP-N-acetylglucosamine acyltransferase